LKNILDTTQNSIPHFRAYSSFFSRRVVSVDRSKHSDHFLPTVAPCGAYDRYIALWLLLCLLSLATCRSVVMTVGSSPKPTTNAAPPGTDVDEQSTSAKPAAVSRETIESVIRGQRRMKGTILSVETGKCIITGELGEFPFALSAVKQNKRFPDRDPKAGDRCDFKLSDTNPVKATSIRVMVPKSELPASDSREEIREATGGELGPGLIASCSTSASVQLTNCVTASSLARSDGAGHSGIDDLCNAFKRFGSSAVGGSSSLFSA
jgi:hypothetical protein